MAKFIDLCNKYFNEHDFYEILGVSKTSSDKEVRKAYHKLSLKVHPDRVSDEDKSEATEKFKILGRIYSTLSSKEKRSIYDQTGSIDDDDGGTFEDSDFDWLNYWRCIFKPLSQKNIQDYEKQYKGSEEETSDLKKAYVNGKGDMDFILEAVPFSNCEEEPRLKAIIQKFIDSGEVPEYDRFVNENPRKTARRKRKYEEEARQAALIASPIDLDDSGEEALKELIQSKQRERGEQMNSFFDQLAAKYGGKEKPKAKVGGKEKPKAKVGARRKKN